MHLQPWKYFIYIKMIIIIIIFRKTCIKNALLSKW